MIDPFLEIGPHVTALPVVHGSGDFAWEVRRIMISNEYDCLAVPLPPSFQTVTEEAIIRLPDPGIVVQTDRTFESTPWESTEWNEDGAENDDHSKPGASYVPIDPCQSVIAALRTAIGDRVPRRFIDLETSRYEPNSRPLPDAYALKRVPIQKFAAAVLPHLSPPENRRQWDQRISHMAWRLRELSVDFRKILFVVNILDWPWVRSAFLSRNLERFEDQTVHDPAACQVDRETLYFLLGEIPYITDLYERARATLADDSHLSIDGVKELLIHARADYRREYKNRARQISPRTLTICLKYIRNLTLIEHGLSPQLTTIITAARQIVGDGFALSVLARAREYQSAAGDLLPEIKMGIGEASFPDGSVLSMTSRLPGPPIIWTRLKLTPRPDQQQQSEWEQRWDPWSHCSWPAEDIQIENFRQTVFDRALETMGADQAKTEKFTTSVKDGIDIRDTIRNWHEGDIYVKTLPPNRGKLDCVVMLFDSPADPRCYPWRTTWYAEHKEESTLCFYATNFMDEPVGPGVCLATYGGALFLYPPVGIPDVWSDRRLDFASTLEERLLAGACLYTRCPHIALLSTAAPGPAWRQLAKRFGKKWVHLPLSKFSDSTVQQLRMVHVLNGKQVRSYAADFIRRV